MAWQMAAAMVGSSLLSGMMGQSSAKRAAQAQSNATAASIRAQRESDDKFYANQARIQQMLSPYVQAGYEALGYSPAQAQQFSMPTQPQQEVPTAIPSQEPVYTAPDGRRISEGENNLREYYRSQGVAFPELLSQDFRPDVYTTPVPTDSRVKPSFEGVPVNAQGTAVSGTPTGASPAAPTGVGGGGINLRTFQQGASMGQPILEALTKAGTREIPRLSEFAETGYDANMMQRKIAGLEGAEAQQEAIDIIANEPYVQEQIRQGEEAILSNASATGGLRGGNTQAALAEFRPQIVAQAIRDRFATLDPMTARGANVSQYITGTGGTVGQGLYGGAQNVTQDVARMGLSAAGGQPQGSPGTAPVTSLIAQQGAIDAGSKLAQGNAWSNALNTGVSNYFTARQMGLFNNPQQANVMPTTYGQNMSPAQGVPQTWEMPQQYPTSP